MSTVNRLGSVEFKGSFDQPRHGFYIGSDQFDGWLDGTDVRGDMVDLPLAHGSFDLPRYRTSRTVTMGGLCYASSRRELLWMRSQFTGLLADGSSGRFTVDMEGWTTFADLRLAAQPTFRRVPGGVPFAQYSLALWSPDPRIFGDTQTVTGTSVTAFHYGNFPADPVVTVAGPRVGGYTITGPGGALFTVTQDPGAGHAHTIDFATGLVSLDGVVQSGVITNADTWTVGPGQQVAMSISSGSMTVAVKDTYI